MKLESFNQSKLQPLFNYYDERLWLNWVFPIAWLQADFHLLILIKSITNKIN